MSKFKNPVRKVKSVAHTGDDQRYKFSNRINNMNKSCDLGNNITASQNGNNVTVRCGCGVSFMTQCGGCFDETDALVNFYDEHRQ